MTQNLTDINLADMLRRDLESLLAEPESVLYVDEYGLDVTLNTFHFLRSRVEYSEALTNMLNEFSETRHPYEAWWNTLEAWFDSLGIEEPRGDNTYNKDNACSHDFQYSQFRYEDEEYIVLQVHLGGDIRGNYSRPCIFQFTDPDYFYDWSRVSMSNGEQYMDSDDAGYHWYDNEGGQEVDFARAPLSDLYDLDVEHAEQEITAYIRMMQDAGRDPDRQLAMGRARVSRAKPDAIAKSADIPDVIFYDDEGNGYLEGKQLYPGGVSF